MVNDKGNGQLATIIVVLSMLALAVAYIAASVVDTTGQVKDTVGVIMVVLGALALYLQTAQTKSKVESIHQRTEQVVQTVAAVETIAKETARNVDGLNKAALINQASVSDAQGFNRGVVETVKAAAAVADTFATPAATPTQKPEVYTGGDIEITAPASLEIKLPSPPTEVVKPILPSATIEDKPKKRSK